MSLQERLHLEKSPVYLMDGSAFIYRGFFSNRAMQRSDGFPTNALVVVFRILLRLLREEKPKYFAFVLDGKGKNFRHDIFPLYKANRDATPEDLIRQIEPIKRAVQALGLALEVSQGCEADDCLASLAARIAQERPVVIVSSDKDLRQCLRDNVYLWDPAGKEDKVQSLQDFREQYGIEPAAWADMQALMGDTADNIPGVPGIGPKTAEKIFKQFKSLEDIRDRFSQLEPKMQAKMANHMEAIFMYRELTRLSCSYCQNIGLPDLAVREPAVQELGVMMAEFELNALRRDVDTFIRAQNKMHSPAATPKAENAPAAPASAGGQVQMSLFSLSPTPLDMPEMQRPDSLNCAQKEVAFLYPRGFENSPVLAMEGRQWLYTGNIEALVPFLAVARRVVCPDVKSLLTRQACWWAVPEATWFDLGLAVYVLNPEENDYGWPKLAARWAGALGLAAQDAGLLALRMAEQLEQQMQAAALLPLFTTLEMPLIGVLARMEAQGIAINSRAFATFLQEVQHELDMLTTHIYAQTGEFNIRSAQQLGEVLFTRLQLPTPKKTKGGQFSTNQDALEKLAGEHPVVDSVLQYRKLEKMRSTYLAPLPRLIDPKGRIHTTFNQTATATGRLSSSNPNLQNIPVRGDLGKRMRTCFVAREGASLISADYSQVELRVLAHVSQEPALLEAFRHGEDIHRRTAALIFDLPPEDITPDQRRSAKTINFGLIYGMGAQKLARELGISTTQARDFIEQYFTRLGKLKTFYESIEAQAKEQGFVTTLAGRRRLLPDIYSNNGQAFALARRQAINTVIQGSAADVIKLAMLAVQRDAQLADYKARLVLQVHDELLLEVADEHAAAVGERVAALMAAVRPDGQALSVPLLVDWGVGKNWGDAH